LCETANVVLPANARLNAELFVIPTANVIISCLLLVGILKLFSGMVIYKYRLKYLELNDNESPVFLEFKEKNKEEYMHMIHTTYFCERIALRLSFDVDALKCAGYYHKLVDKQKEMMEDLSRFSRKITLWGSSKVVNKWVEFRENGTNPQTAAQNLFLLEEIMNEMRKDLGLKKVQKGNLLAFFVNDIKQIMKKK
jgi:hypothetical protein